MMTTRLLLRLNRKHPRTVGGILDFASGEVFARIHAKLVELAEPITSLFLSRHRTRTGAETYFAEQMQDPEYRRAYEDAKTTPGSREVPPGDVTWH